MSDDWRPAAKRLNDGLRGVLHELPAGKVDAFVRSVGASLGTRDIHQQYGEAERRAALKQLLKETKRFKNAVGAFILARPFPTAIDSPTSVPPLALILMQRRAIDVDAFYAAQAQAATAARELSEQVERALYEAPPPRVGRPPADEFGLLAKLARRYLEIFGKRPTSTRTGEFARIAEIVLEHVRGHECQDVTRQVSAALKGM
jgi:hypothetical protein